MKTPSQDIPPENRKRYLLNTEQLNVTSHCNSTFRQLFVTEEGPNTTYMRASIPLHVLHTNMSIGFN